MVLIKSLNPARIFRTRYSLMKEAEVTPLVALGNLRASMKLLSVCRSGLVCLSLKLLDDTPHYVVVTMIVFLRF